MTPLEKRLTVLGAVVGVASLGIAVLEYSKPSPAPAPSPAPRAVDPPIVGPEPPAPPPPAKLPRILVRRTLGGQLQYLEAITGPPREVIAGTRYYDVDGCDVAIRTDSDQAVNSVAVRVSRACSFQWRDFMPNLRGLGPPEETTIGQFLRVAMQSTITRVGGCLTSCGNAADPEIWLYRVGSHADEWINVRISYTNNSPRELEATRRFAQAVETNLSFDATLDLTTTCDRRIVGWMDSTIGALAVEEVEFTFDRRADDRSNCDLTLPL